MNENFEIEVQRKRVLNLCDRVVQLSEKIVKLELNLIYSNVKYNPLIEVTYKLIKITEKISKLKKDLEPRISETNSGVAYMFWELTNLIDYTIDLQGRILDVYY